MEQGKASSLSLFENVALVLRGRFAPIDNLSRKKKDDRPVTLFSAVLGNFGLGHSDSFLSARNHQEIHRAVKWTYSVLDDVTGTRSQLWAMQPGRTENEVVDVLVKAGLRHPATEFDGLTADLRVGLAKVAGRGKMRGALACEAARVAYLSDTDFAEVISPLVLEGMTDDDVLADLESVSGAIRTGDADWSTAKKWTLGYNEYAKTDPLNLSLGAYCMWLANGWKDITDEQLTVCLDKTLRPAA